MGLSVEMEISGRAFFRLLLRGARRSWWTDVLNLALPLQRHRPDTQAEHQDLVSHMAQNKREKKKRKKEKINKVIKTKNNY